jgi:hypothetical protein
LIWPDRRGRTAFDPKYLCRCPELVVDDSSHVISGDGGTPHVARYISGHRGSNIDGRTTRHPGYALSQATRKRFEEANG